MENDLPEGYRADYVPCSDVTLHVVHNGPRWDGKPLKDDRQPILLLHGFPEFWLAWEKVIQALGDDYLVIVPDQRGYNKSDAPKSAKNYKARLLVEDMVSLSSAMLGGRSFVLGGHDWGASIAYALAINHPQLVSRLLIANGVHPVCFQNAMINHPAQAKASSYFHVLRRDDASSLMVEDDFRRTFSMFERFSSSPWLTDDLKDLYRTAWSGTERMAAMLHWYNSSPIIVPVEGEAVPPAPLYGVKSDVMRIIMPHTLVWGKGDQALLPVCHEELGDFCDQLDKLELGDADHWLLHTHGEQVADALRNLINS